MSGINIFTHTNFEVAGRKNESQSLTIHCDLCEKSFKMDSETYKIAIELKELTTEYLTAPPRCLWCKNQPK